MPNPFLEEDNVVEVPRPASVKASKQPVPSPPPAPKKADKNKRKGGAPLDKGEGSKKPRSAEVASPHPISILFGEMARNNFAAKDVHRWYDRPDDETECSFKQAVGEVFFQGLTQLSLKMTQVKELEAENAHLKSAEATIRAEFEVYKKKSSDEAMQTKKDMGRLQYEVDTLKLDLLKKNN